MNTPISKSIVCELNKEKGFTLIELLVGMSIFLLVVMGGVGSLVFALRLQRILLMRQTVASEMNFNIEYMSRALRMAIPDPDGSCTGLQGRTYEVESGGTSLRFINRLQGDTCQRFFLEGDRLKYRNMDGDELYMSSPHTNIDDLRFIVSGEESGDGSQPQVTIFIKAGPENFSNPLRLQTTVSARRLDVSL